MTSAPRWKRGDTVIACAIAFYGGDYDDRGMPAPYHNYFVLASTLPAAHAVIVSILPVSSAAPEPQPREFLAVAKAEDDAVDEAEKYLRQLTANSDLNVQRSYYPPRHAD
jgi:hypothetical protein